MRLEATSGALRSSAERLFSLVEQVTGEQPQALGNEYYKAQVNGAGFVYLRLIGARARTFPAHSIHLHTGWHEQLAGEGVTQNKNWHGNTPSADMTARADQPNEISLAEDFIRNAYRVHVRHGDNRLGDGGETTPAQTKLPAPSPSRYAAAFQAISGLTDLQFQLLRVHYHALERTVTAKHLAELVGYSSYSVANSQYGRLARLIGEQLDYHPERERLGTLVTFDKRQGEWHWIMRPEVANALEQLGWVEGDGVLLPEEIAAAAEPMVEGARYRVMVSAYEREPEARRLCIAAHGTNCCVCGFSFGAIYGDVGEGFIHVHHLRPLAEAGGAHEVDPVEDLRPVCPNCHAILHRRVPAYGIEDVRAFLAQRKA